LAVAANVCSTTRLRQGERHTRQQQDRHNRYVTGWKRKIRKASNAVFNQVDSSDRAGSYGL
jgi:hypothetical protein